MATELTTVWVDRYTANIYIISGTNMIETVFADTTGWVQAGSTNSDAIWRSGNLPPIMNGTYVGYRVPDDLPLYMNRASVYTSVLRIAAQQNDSADYVLVQTTTAPEIVANPSVTSAPSTKPAYTLAFTVDHPTVTGADRLIWEVRTAANRGGELVARGTCTAGIEATPVITDALLEQGPNTRYLYVHAGSLVYDEASFVVDSPFERQTYRVTSGSDDGSYFTGSNGFNPSSTQFHLGGYSDSSGILQCNSWMRVRGVQVENPEQLFAAHLIMRPTYTSKLLYPTRDYIYNIAFADEDNASNPVDATDFGDGPFTTKLPIAVDGLAHRSNELYTSPDLYDSLIEVFERPGWSSGNAVALYTTYDASQGTDVFRIYGSTYESNPNNLPELVLFIITNESPKITVAPILDYGIGNTAVGPNNSASVQFTATDDSDTGSNKLTYEVRTAASGGGTLIKTGTCTHNVSKTITLTDAELSSLPEGDTTLYLSILDSENARSDDESFVIRRDSVAPEDSTDISYTPAPVQPDVSQYTVTFTPHDATTTETNALDYQIRTASGGGGTLLASGVATSGMPSTSATITDPALVYGNNTRYIRVIDGALNARDTSFTVALDAYNETGAPAQVVRVVLTGDEYLTLDEEKLTPLVLEVATGGRDSAERNELVTQALVILAHTEAVDYLNIYELDTTLLLLAKTLGDDALLRGIEEFGPELTLKLVTAGTDQANFRDTETGQELLLPVVGGGVDTQAMDEESAPSVRIYAVSRGDDSLTLNEETAPTQTLLAVVTGVDNQAHDEVSLAELVLQAVTGGSDAPMYLETFGELLLLSVTAADTEQLSYAHFEPLVIPVVTAADPDTQEMEETAVTLQILVVTAGSDAQGGVIDDLDAPELEIPVFTLGEDTYTIGPIISYRTYNFAERNPYDQSTMIVN